MKKFRKTIRGKLSILLIGLTVAALFGTSIILVLIAQNNIITTEKKSLTNYAKCYSSEIDGFFRTKQNMMQGIADGLVMGGQYNNKERTRKTLHNYKNIRKEDLINLYYIYPDQTIYRMSDAEGARKPYDVEKEQWYQDTVKEKKMVVTAPYIEALSGDLLVTMSCPVLDNHKLVGVLSAEINIQELVDITNSATSVGGMYGILVDQNGNYVVHPDSDLTLKLEQIVAVDASLQPLFADMKIHKIRDFKNTEVYIKAVPVESCGWTYVISEETTVLQMTQNKMLTVTISILVWACMIMTVVMILMLRYHLRPVEDLKKFVQEIITVGQEKKTYKNEREQIQNLVVRLEEYVISAIKQTRLNAGSIHNNVDEMNQQIVQMQDQMLHFLENKKEMDSDYEHQTALTRELGTSCNGIVGQVEKIEGNLKETIQHTKRWRQHMDQLLPKIQEDKKNASAQMQQSRLELEKNLEEMQVLKKLVDVVNTIHAMTDQTSLMALRACIEATHTGKHGFAIASDEIKNLSDSTNEKIEQLEILLNQALSALQDFDESITKEWERMEQSVQMNYKHMETIVAGSQKNAEYYQSRNTAILTLGTEIEADLTKIANRRENLVASQNELNQKMQSCASALETMQKNMGEMVEDAGHILETSDHLRENMSKFHV